MIWFRADFLFPLLVYTLVVCIFLIGKKIAFKKGLKLSKQDENHQNLELISVVIPFRNEEENLGRLLESLANLTNFPLEFIFVNDHSSDDSIQIIKNFNKYFPFQILELPTDEFGKKSALRLGIDSAEGDYILTWDADIEVLPMYFQKLSQFTWGDLMILPVEMKWKSWVQGFFAWDYQLQFQTSFALQGFGKNISASGANLFFKKSVFLEMEKVRSDQNVLSGDDQFLLAACKKFNKNIQFFSNRELTVFTKAPTGFLEGLQQRSRWLKKTSSVKDNFATFFGAFVLLVQLGFYFFVGFHFIERNLLLAVLLLLIKGELDGILCGVDFQKKTKTLHAFGFTFFFPFYILFLVLKTLYFKPIWKERTLY